MNAEMKGLFNVSLSSQFVIRRVARVVTLASVPVLFGACEWFTDFKDQPRIEPWESYGFANGGLDSLNTDTIPMRGQPAGSIPMSGSTVPVWRVSYSRFPAALDSVAAIVANPTPMSQASLDNGRMHYQINCATCHGDTGIGDGASTVFGMVPFPITGQASQSRSDGYIWAIMRNGRGLMPSYNRIDEMDRWDVVNYVRALQGQAAGFTVETGPLAAPGEGGEFVPRGSSTAPTRPVPHARPSTWLQRQAAPVQRGVSPASGSAPASPAAPSAAQSADSGSIS